MKAFRYWSLVIVAVVSLGVAKAESLVIYPFDSQDPRLGALMAQRAAEALVPHADVYGPAVAPVLMPPVYVAGGFYNLARLLPDPGSATGAALLRGGLGAGAVVTAQLDNVDEWLIARLHIATRDATRTFSLEAPADDPGGLVQRITGVIAVQLGLAVVPGTGDIDLAGPDAATALAVHLAGTGDIAGMERALEQADPSDPTAAALAAALESVRTGTFTGDPALLAALALSQPSIGAHATAAYFGALSEHTDLPAPVLWEAALMVDAGEVEEAGRLYSDAAVYPFGVAAQAAWLELEREDVSELVAGSDVAALLALSLLAQAREDTGFEEELLTTVSRLAPEMTYPFERISFIAFDRDDPLAAGRALAIASRLEPDSDLYWTNLGWAQYLLGQLAQSEESSRNALLLSPDQVIAGYNLGLVHTVTGRLATAIEAYTATLAQDSAVNEAAIEDLENARELYPGEPAVHYSLAWLLEAAGRRAAAAGSYRDYLAGAPEGDFSVRALERIERLEAPPPELQLPGGFTLQLGSQRVDETLQPGDYLRPSFEVYTPGESLPTSMDVSFAVADATGATVHRETHGITLPLDTIGFVVDGLPFSLPFDLEPGEVTVIVTVTASEDRAVSEAATFRVVQRDDPLRRLVGLGITMQYLESGQSLFDRTDLGNWPEVFARIESELDAFGEAASEVITEIASGRFSGLDGGDAFAATTERDVLDFLDWVAVEELEGSSFNFVEAYAQWLVEGTPRQ